MKVAEEAVPEPRLSSELRRNIRCLCWVAFWQIEPAALRASARFWPSCAGSLAAQHRLQNVAEVQRAALKVRQLTR